MAVQVETLPECVRYRRRGIKVEICFYRDGDVNVTMLSRTFVYILDRHCETLQFYRDSRNFIEYEVNHRRGTLTINVCKGDVEKSICYEKEKLSLDGRKARKILADFEKIVEIILNNVSIAKVERESTAVW